MNEVMKFLKEHGAGRELEMFGAGQTSLARFWRRCPNVEWLLWTLEKLHQNSLEELRLLACWCARNVWSAMSDDRSRQAVILAEQYARGQCTRPELNAGQYAAVKAAQHLTASGSPLLAWAAWTACATTLFPSLEAAKNAVRRYKRVVTEDPSVLKDSTRDFVTLSPAEKLRDLVPNPFGLDTIARYVDRLQSGPQLTPFAGV